MKALYFEEHGDLNVIQYGDVSDPAAGSDDVVVRVRYYKNVVSFLIKLATFQASGWAER